MVNLVAIIDYGSGNLHSAAKAFERAAREEGLNAEICVTSDPDLVRKAERIVLPGVGAFADCRRGLDAVTGMVEAITEATQVHAKPFLGICVGMQLLATRGLEYSVTEGLNWIPGDVKLITPNDPSLKIPHMGWNNLHLQKEHALLADIPMGAGVKPSEVGTGAREGYTTKQDSHAYFVHSYALQPDEPSDVIALADYGGPVTALVARGNIAGTQFHPEKSQTLGLKLIGNFLRWKP